MSTHDPLHAAITRRRFLYCSALAAATMGTFNTYAKSRPRKLRPGDKLRLACVGIDGKGRSDVQHCGNEEIVALCDADEGRGERVRKTFPNAKFYTDWRQLLDKEEANIDAVVVSTPDHLTPSLPRRP